MLFVVKSFRTNLKQINNQIERETIIRLEWLSNMILVNVVQSVQACNIFVICFNICFLLSIVYIWMVMLNLDPQLCVKYNDTLHIIILMLLMLIFIIRTQNQLLPVNCSDFLHFWLIVKPETYFYWYALLNNVLLF